MMLTPRKNNYLMKIGIVVPHIFMHRSILPQVIFSPAELALDLANELQKHKNVEVTLFTPGPVDTPVRNITADLSYFEHELAGRGDTYIDLLKKHPVTFITLARQVQAEIIAAAFAMANCGDLDIVHIYTNEEDIALPFAALCNKPVVFTHHDPFNFLVKYKNVFPKYKQLNWISISNAQRKGMPKDTNWIGTVYHGIQKDLFTPNYSPSGEYIAYLGRIIEPKGVHLAIEATKQYNTAHGTHLKLKIAGKHYAGDKDTYWQKHIKPQIDSDTIEYVGFIKSVAEKQHFLGNAKALIIPSTFEEPFGMVMIEALACGTPIIGSDSGAIPEVIRPGTTGILVRKNDETYTLADAIADIDTVDRHACRADFEARFTATRMGREHLNVYESTCRSQKQ
jgi:glycosyltransferase involved in cell wall biosynthesis